MKMLPDELLAEILDCATLKKQAHCSEAHHQIRDYETIRSLALVCRRFRRIVTPLLFESIRFTQSRLPERTMVPPSGRVRKLHQVLQSNPALRSLCQALHVEIDDTAQIDVEDFDIANDFVSWFSNLRDLVIVGGFYSSTSDTVRDNTLALVRRTQELIKVRQLNIEGNMWYETGGISLAEVVRNTNDSSLKTLEVTAAGLSDPSTISEMLTPEVGREDFAHIDFD